MRYDDNGEASLFLGGRRNPKGRQQLSAVAERAPDSLYNQSRRMRTFMLTAAFSGPNGYLAAVLLTPRNNWYVSVSELPERRLTKSVLTTLGPPAYIVLQYFIDLDR